MDPFTAALAAALAEGLVEVGVRLLEEGAGALVGPSWQRVKRAIQTPAREAEKDERLLGAIRAALKDVDAPLDKEDQLLAWARRTGLDRLQAPKAVALRRQLALAVIEYTDPNAPPPEDLVIALGWPRSRVAELSRLLSGLRTHLMGLDAWEPLLAFAGQEANRALLREVTTSLSLIQKTLLTTPQGEALRVVLLQQDMSAAEAERIDRVYRQSVCNEFEMLKTQGLSPAQLPKAIRLPLQDVYLELGLLSLRDDRQRERDAQAELELREAERLRQERERLRQRVSAALAENPRLVIVGKPGSGKTVSLKFIALHLALGGVGAARLGLPAAYLPLYVRLAEYALAIKRHGARLALETFLLDYIQHNYPGTPRQREYLQRALDHGLGLVLLDGLDEVGDIGDTRLHGRTLRSLVLEEVERFAAQRCRPAHGNRLVVSSRLEGYHAGELPGFAEAELSPLLVPEEVEEFLLRWFTCYEREYQPALAEEAALRTARKKSAGLLADILQSESVQRLAMNPLLLTILAMIHETGARLPHQRVKVYETVTRTMVESWRQAQVGQVNNIHPPLPANKIFELLASLAYWLHDTQPGGALPLEQWQRKVRALLTEEEDDAQKRKELEAVSEEFLCHAREEVGLLAERSPGKIGFFHLTLEEYLAAVEIARQESEARQELVEQHWQNPRWQEVILLAAGHLMLMNSKGLDGFVTGLRQLESGAPEQAGRGALLAGKALIDAGPQAFKRKVVREVRADLVEVMQDLDPDTQRPAQPGRAPLPTRAEAAALLDELGWLPEDLYGFVPVSQAQAPQFYLARYPVTNAQYRRFVEADDFGERALWCGFPRYDEGGRPMKEDWGTAGWDWLQKQARDEQGRVYPRYWNNPRFGIARRGAPVVRITWYEANAYCRWLQQHWAELDEGRANPGWQPGLVRLPLEAEWIAAAGGAEPKERYPWDGSGQATRDEAEILRRANVSESGIGRTTPVGMYPLGVSPLGVWDMAGNVWEWQANFYGKEHNRLAMRGGAWRNPPVDARLSGRRDLRPDLEWYFIGFRVAALPR